jgi:hypothetical protein
MEASGGEDATMRHRVLSGVPPALPSNQPVGFELPGGAGDEDFADGDGRDREEHPDRATQDGPSQDPGHHDERVKLDRATEDDRLIDRVLE